MTGDTVIALAALGVAVVGIPIAVLATRRWGNRRAKVDLSFRSLPLIPEGVHAGLLALSYRDFVVNNPHLVEVVIINVGPRDVSSSAFDSGKSITIAFDKTFYGVTGIAGGLLLTSPAVGMTAPAVVSIAPVLLKRGESWRFTAVLEGAPEIVVDSPLVDTDLRVLNGRQEGSEVRVKLNLMGLSAEIPVRLPARVRR